MRSYRARSILKCRHVWTIRSPKLDAPSSPHFKRYRNGPQSESCRSGLKSRAREGSQLSQGFARLSRFRRISYSSECRLEEIGCAIDLFGGEFAFFDSTAKQVLQGRPLLSRRSPNGGGDFFVSKTEL